MLFGPKPEPLEIPEDQNRERMAVPGRNALATVIQEEPGIYKILEVELKYGGFIKLLTKILKARNRKRIQLDGLSLIIYDYIDGKRNVGDIIFMLQDRFNLSYFETRSLCLYYLQKMSGGGLIALGVLKEEVVETSSAD